MGKLPLLAAAGLFVVGIIGFLLVGRPAPDWAVPPITSPSAVVQVQRVLPTPTQIPGTTEPPPLEFELPTLPTPSPTPSPEPSSTVAPPVFAAGSGAVQPIGQPGISSESETATDTPTATPTTASPSTEGVSGWSWRTPTPSPTPTIIWTWDMLPDVLTPTPQPTRDTTPEPSSTPEPTGTAGHGRGDSPTGTATATSTEGEITECGTATADDAVIVCTVTAGGSTR